MSSVIPVRLSPVDDTDCLCSVYHAWLLSLSSWCQHLRSSALALCYSVAQYCFPVWTYFCRITSLVDIRLNSATCLITVTLHSAPLSCLPVLANVESPALRWEAAVDTGQADWEDSPTWRMAAPSCCYLPSCRTLRLDADLLDIMRQWQDDWKWMMPQSTNQDYISHDVMEPRWTAYGLTNVTAHPLAKCGVLEQLTVSMWQMTRCLTSLAAAHRRNWRVACSGFTELMMLLFSGLQHVASKCTRYLQ